MSFFFWDISATKVFPQLSGSINSLQRLLRTRLWAKILAAIILGIGTGIALSPEGGGLVSAQSADLWGAWLALPGKIFLSLIQMIVIPLVICSVVLGIASSDSTGSLKKVGIRIIPYFLCTTAIAVTIGATTASLIKPGDWVDKDLVKQQLGTEEQTISTNLENIAPVDKEPLPEKIVSIIPTNPMEAALEQEMFQVVIFAILLGIAIATIKKQDAEPLLGVFRALLEVSMKIVSWAMILVPYAVFGLLAQITLKIGIDVLLGMAVYVGTVLLGLLALMAVYLVIIALIGRRNPLRFLYNIKEVQLLAFSTSSSAAVMPLSIKTAEEKLHLSPSIVRFMIPLGATVNMDGTALYQTIAALFLTQVFGIELTTGQLVLLMATTIGASIGAPSTPGVGIVILASILEGIGVPASGMALIIGVDRILDMSRTTVNVTGDLVACTVMQRWIGELPNQTNLPHVENETGPAEEAG